MKPRLRYRLVWRDGQVREHSSEAAALADIVPNKPDGVIVETRNGALREESTDCWGSGLRVVAEEKLHYLRSRVYRRAEDRWGGA